MCDGWLVVGDQSGSDETQTQREPVDLELLQAWADGDQLKGRTLYRRYHPVVVRFFINKVTDETGDLVQATFLAALEGATNYRGDGPFRSWLLTVARRVLYRHFERQRRGALPIDDVSIIDMGTSPSSRIAKTEQHRILLDALRKLPLAQQVAIELHYWEGMSNREISEITEWPMGTVQTRIQRARRRLGTLIANRVQVAGMELPNDFDEWVDRVRSVMSEY